MAIRITNNMMVDKFKGNLQKNLQKMNQYTSQLSTQRRMVHISDDPVGVLDTLTARTRLLDIQRYQDNLEKTRSWTAAADTALQQISSHMTNTLESVVQAATDVNNDSDRDNIAKMVSGLRDTVKEALNTAVGTQYIFAGYNTSNPPFTVAADGTILYNGLDLSNITDPVNKALIDAEMVQQMQMEVGFELDMDMSMPGLEVAGVGDNNMFKIMNDIIDLMENGSTADDVSEKLSESISKLQKAHENITTCLVKTASAETRYDMLNSRYSMDEVNYTEIKTHVEDIDAAETIMYWKMAEAVYNQCLAVGAKVIQPTLLDFLGR